MIRPSREYVHEWFGLSYANYLVLQRSLLQSMPEEWQRRFVELMNELDDSYRHIELPLSYRVHPVDSSGRYTRDPIPHYNRGRTYIEPAPVDVEDRA